MFRPVSYVLFASALGSLYVIDFLFLSFFFFSCYGDHRDLHSFPTRRSSDLPPLPSSPPGSRSAPPAARRPARGPFRRDRKSTRLNSSHRCISYAVFCLKKKNLTTLLYAEYLPLLYSWSVSFSHYSLYTLSLP